MQSFVEIFAPIQRLRVNAVAPWEFIGLVCSVSNYIYNAIEIDYRNVCDCAGEICVFLYYRKTCGTFFDR